MTLVRRRPYIAACHAAALASIILATPMGARGAVAAEPAAVPPRPLSDVELAKINQTIAEKGTEIRLNREITTLLGITRGDELLASRGIAVKDEVGDVHEFEPLSGGKGYLLLKLGAQLNVIYWVNQEFVLTAARSRVPGQASEELPIAEARAGVAKELGYWAAFARE